MIWLALLILWIVPAIIIYYLGKLALKEKSIPAKSIHVICTLSLIPLVGASILYAAIIMLTLDGVLNLLGNEYE